MAENLRDRAAARAQQRKTNGDPAATVAVKPATDPARQILAPMEAEFAAALPPQIPVESFMRVCLTMLKDDKAGQALMRCKRPTLYKAMLDAARFGLMPGTDECAIVAFKDTATFIPQYQGFVQMFYNTGQVAAVEAHLIHREDDWGLAYGDGGGFYHRPRLFDAEGQAVDRGPAILAYCYVKLRDGSRTSVEFVTRQDAIEVRDTYSRSYQNAEKSWDGRPPKRDSTWHRDFDKMWLKTAVRRVAKWAPKSPALLELLAYDAKADSALSPPFTPGGPAAAWPGDVNHGTVAVGEVVPGAITSGGEPQDPPGNGSNGPATATGAGSAAGANGTPRSEAMHAIRQALDTAGLTADTDKPLRLAIAGIMASPHGPPLTLRSLAELTGPQAVTAAATLAELSARCTAEGRDLGGVLRGAAAESGSDDADV